MGNDILKGDFDKIERRAALLRLTERELIESLDPPMGYTSFWRAKTNESTLNTRVKILRRVENALDEMERAKA